MPPSDDNSVPRSGAGLSATTISCKSASDIAADPAAASVLGKLASLLSCSRMGNGGGSATSSGNNGHSNTRAGNATNDLQTAQLKEALSKLVADNGSSSTSLTIPSMSTQTTASSIVYAQRHSDNLQNVGPEDTTALKLSTPLLAHGAGGIPELPAQLRDNIATTLRGLVDSRIKSSLSVLVKQMINLGSLDEAKLLAKMAQNPAAISINAIVTTFRLVKQTESSPTTQAYGMETMNLPLIFEVVADISVHNNKTSTLMMTSSGTIAGTFDTSLDASRTSDGKFSPNTHLLKDAVVTIDTVALLTAMVTQVRKVAKVAVRHMTELICTAVAQERENERKRAAAVEAYNQRQQQEEEEKRLFQLLQQHNQMQPMQQQQQQQPPLNDLIDLNQLHSILGQSGSSSSSAANMASLASVASLINGPYAKSEHNLATGGAAGGLLAGQSRGNLMQSGTQNQHFFPIANSNNNNKHIAVVESLSNLQPLPFISRNHFNQHNQQMQQMNTSNNSNNLNQLFPTLPTSHKPQYHRRLSEEEMEETRKMIDSSEGLPSGLAQVAAELRVETKEAIKKRKAKRRRSSAGSNATADSSSSSAAYNFSLDTITDGADEEEAQPLTLSTLFYKQDKMFEEERRKRSAAEALLGCNQGNCGDVGSGSGSGGGGAVQASSTLLPSTSVGSTAIRAQQDQLLVLLQQSGADAATTEAAANLLFKSPPKTHHQQMYMQLAANGTANANMNTNTNAISQALQASAPSMLSLFTPEGHNSTGNGIASIAASFVSGNLPHSFSSLSAGSLWDRKRSTRSLSGEINVTEGNLKKKVSFNMVNETFTTL
mmetsp:Transcript_11301/g.18791  ORF Transcript_11301/g.18791 Transcript_11301/m.18791 type:complete len:827 (-) Transcript_11301:809-3289(-)|eukprot:CAMPEP_0197719650 /NCGR_PEP_ID=MMETSP1434-20131217/3320_1 /TAXON_ID=265543 /ORGANISM="Minutocellus polymorphus, Strain CCMP3303" /LENGTH=826 /DNA_ID=CAMNT_0043304417 /DNA_START=134 /DNA_END=2614 /DNA_ORIENTATION=+